MSGRNGDNPQSDPPYAVVGRFKKLLSANQPGGLLEGSPGGGEPDLSEGGIEERLTATRAALHRIVKMHLGDKTDLHAIADRLVASGVDALKVLGDGDEQRLRQNPDMLSTLEAIVRLDGSRPSFMIRDGAVDRSTSLIGVWADTLDASEELLRDAIACVGRIDLPGAPQGFAGTGFLIQRDLIVTNRHVLQLIGDRDDDGAWQLRAGAAIDFGHEFRAQASLGRRRLRRVVFSGAAPITTSGPVDHRKLDLVVIELEAAPARNAPRTVLAVDRAPDWPQPDLPMFTIGYPGAPDPRVAAPSLLEDLFQATYGCKRLAPGLVMTSQLNVQPWTAAHDATTLGGNSGSVVLVVGREYAAAGLHYGGRGSKNDPVRENWAHILGLALNEPDGQSATPLGELLKQRGVRLIDRTQSGPANPANGD